MDRLYSSFAIAKWLFDKKITMVSTTQGNHVGIPDEIRSTKFRKLLNSQIYHQKNWPTSISNYVVKTSKGKKSVMMLSTIKPSRGVTTDDDKQKPAVDKPYDFTEGRQILWIRGFNFIL